MVEQDIHALICKRSGCGLQNTDYLKTLCTAGPGLLPASDALQEMLALQSQRFCVVKMGCIHVPIVVGAVEFRESSVVGWDFDPLVVYPDLLQRFGVVIEDHFLASHECHSPDFVGIEPAIMDGRKAPIGEFECHADHILYAVTEVRFSLTVHRGRELAHDVQDDGDIVGGQVPDHVDILLKQPQIEPTRTDIIKLPNLAGINDLLNAFDGRTEQESVAHHDNQLELFTEFDKLLALGGGASHRFFDQYMFARQQSLFCQGVVGSGRACDHDRIDVRILEKCVCVG